ncbi:MAG: apolipoprotein N-acyltransferase, partial [Gammaproteobacteria bacterium]
MNFRAATASAAAGVCAALSFAPLEYWWLMFPALAAFFALALRAKNRAAAAVCGFAFGLAYFGCGLHWIFGALNGYIGLPFIAAAAVFILLCAALSAYPALVAAVSWRLGGAAFAAAWALGEWLRGQLFSGFPWLAVAYSQPPETPVYGWLPLAGIAGANLALALAAGIAADFPREKKMRAAAALSLALILIGGVLPNEWTRPAGKIKVSLLQGNVAQELKWRAGEVEKAMADYLRMARASSGRWIILPETALPLRRRDLPETYRAALREIAEEREGAVIAGMFTEDEGGLYNAAAVIGAPAPAYHKRHLTPYGEYLPFAGVLRPLLLAADIPYNSLAAGAPAAVAELPGGRAAFSICYEDIFPGEWRARLPQAQILINITNDGWFDGTAMPRQHLRMAQARAAEFGRFLLRATNTGITAIADHRGAVAAELPPGEQGALHFEAELREGATPFVRFGDAPALIVS